MSLTNPLSTELKIFEQHRVEWAQSYPGKYVVIQGTAVLPDFFSTYAEAFRAGLKRFGKSHNFLVKQIWVSEPVYLVS
jgi:hypothetical protein